MLEFTNEFEGITQIIGAKCGGVHNQDLGTDDGCLLETASRIEKIIAEYGLKRIGF